MRLRQDQLTSPGKMLAVRLIPASVIPVSGDKSFHKFDGKA